MFWNEQHNGTRQPPNIFSANHTKITKIKTYACKLPGDDILNHFGQALNNSLGPFQLLLGTGSFQKAEHHFIVMESNRGTFVMTQKYFNGDLILREYNSLQECLQVGIECTGRVSDNHCWEVNSNNVSSHVNIQSLIDFYNGRRAFYVLQNANCQHYSQEWVLYFKY